MKVITIKQPYASMIVNNYKRYEFRSWKTNYRGKLLIHAGNSVNKDDLIYYNYLDIKEYPKMKIIGECELTDCIFAAFFRNNPEKYGRSIEKHRLSVLIIFSD